MREKINTALKEAMKARDQPRVTTLRLINAAIKNRDLGIGTSVPATAGPASDAEIVELMARMIKQRQESAEAFRRAGRAELMQAELDEIALIRTFLPPELSDDAMRAAITGILSETGAQGPKDMGRVMGLLKARYTGQMDLGKASRMVKELLS